MDELIKTVYKLGRLKNYEMGEYRWYSTKFLRDCNDPVVPWQIGYARLLYNRSEDINIVGVVEKNNTFTLISLDKFLKLRDS